jgi:adenylyltransferase/sulfurtransferase
MTLSDAQVERFSRQIILPQIGVTGQERLLSAAVAIDGCGPGLSIAAQYLAGAGIGRIVVHGAERDPLLEALRAVDPALRLWSSTAPLGGAEGAPPDALVAVDLPLAELDRVARGGPPLIAGGTGGPRGWLVVAERRDACASCAARAAGTGGAAGPLASSAAGVIGSLVALETLTLLLGLRPPTGASWQRFDAERSTLETVRLVRRDSCPACATADDAESREGPSRRPRRAAASSGRTQEKR